MKLIWLADRLCLQKYGRMILDVDYVAMRNGPVPSQVMNVTHNTTGLYTRDFLYASGHNIHSISDLDSSCFKKSELDIFHIVWKRFENYGPFDLRDLSHEYPEWKRFESALILNNTSKLMAIDDFFENPTTELSQSDFFDTDEEKLQYMKEKYNNKKALKKAMYEAHNNIDASRVAIAPNH